jgi:hypothetical protein
MNWSNESCLTPVMLTKVESSHNKAMGHSALISLCHREMIGNCHQNCRLTHAIYFKLRLSKASPFSAVWSGKEVDCMLFDASGYNVLNVLDRQHCY